jgi:hypothetical protein
MRNRKNFVFSVPQQQFLSMKKLIPLLLLLLWIATLVFPEAFDQSTTSASAQVTPPPIGGDGQEFGPQKTIQEIYMSIAVLVFGLLVVVAQTLLFYRQKADVEEAFKYFIVTLIIIGALFLVTAGYGNEQIAPILGLLGTIAGYLLGKAFDGKGRRSNPTEK